MESSGRSWRGKGEARPRESSFHVGTLKFCNLMFYFHETDITMLPGGGGGGTGAPGTSRSQKRGPKDRRA